MPLGERARREPAVGMTMSTTKPRQAAGRHGFGSLTTRPGRSPNQATSSAAVVPDAGLRRRRAVRVLGGRDRVAEEVDPGELGRRPGAAGGRWARRSGSPAGRDGEGHRRLERGRRVGAGRQRRGRRRERRGRAARSGRDPRSRAPTGEQRHDAQGGERGCAAHRVRPPPRSPRGQSGRAARPSWAGAASRAGSATGTARRAGSAGTTGTPGRASRRR